MGNAAGVGLIVFSIVVSYTANNNASASASGNDDDQGLGGNLWGRDWSFYLGVASPCVLGLMLATSLTSYLDLKKPERVAVSVECCYQNIGIATSVAMTMFKGNLLADAIGVPLYYGLVEAVLLGFYCIFAWKIGWTKAPVHASFCTIISKSYEIEEMELKYYHEDIEVVLGREIEETGNGHASGTSGNARKWRDLVFFSRNGGGDNVIDPKSLNDITFDDDDESAMTGDGDDYDPNQSRILASLDKRRKRRPTSARNYRGYAKYSSSYNTDTHESLAADGLSVDGESDLESGQSVSGMSLDSEDIFEDHAEIRMQQQQQQQRPASAEDKISRAKELLRNARIMKSNSVIVEKEKGVDMDDVDDDDDDNIVSMYDDLVSL